MQFLRVTGELTSGNLKITEKGSSISESQNSSGVVGKSRNSTNVRLSVKSSGIIHNIPRMGYIQESSDLTIRFNKGDYLIFYVLIV